eukprot:gene6648-26074_t
MFYRKAMVKAKKASRKDVHAEPTHAIKPKERKQKKQKGGSATQPQEGVGDLYLSSIFQMQLRRAKLKEKILNSGKTTGCSDGGAVDDGNTQGTLIIPKKRGSPPSWKSKVTINLAQNKAKIMLEVVEGLGFMPCYRPAASSDAYVIWHSSQPHVESFNKLHEYQKINHLPASQEICRKDSLARNLRPLQAKFPAESWVLPTELNALKKVSQAALAAGKPKTFIYKPSNAAQGIGMTQSAYDLPSASYHAPLLVQEYLADPFLIEGFKFDLRVYVLVTSIDPLQVHMYKDGLVRLSTTAYKKPEQGNLGELFMHLTNYSLNKHSENFDGSDDVGTGSKRTLRWMLEWLDSHGHNSDALWSNMADVIVKTLLTTLPHNVHAYRESRRVLAQNFRTGNLPKAEDSNCFAIYGFDIFLDTLLKPFVIEVNQFPSFSCDSPLDYRIKKGMLTDALQLLKLRPSSKKKILSKQKELTQTRAFESMRIAAKRIKKAQDMKPKPWGTANASYASMARGQRNRNSSGFSENSSNRNSIASSINTNSNSNSNSSIRYRPGGRGKRIGLVKQKSFEQRSGESGGGGANSVSVSSLPPVLLPPPESRPSTAAAEATSAKILAELDAMAANLTRGNKTSTVAASKRGFRPMAMQMEVLPATATHNSSRTGNKGGDGVAELLLGEALDLIDSAAAAAATPVTPPTAPGPPSIEKSSGEESARPDDGSGGSGAKDGGGQVPPQQPLSQSTSLEEVSDDLPQLVVRSGRGSPEGSRRPANKTAIYEDILNEATHAYFKSKSTADLIPGAELKLPPHLVPQEATLYAMKFPPLCLNRATATAIDASSSFSSPLPPPNRKPKKRVTSPYSTAFVMPSI